MDEELFGKIRYAKQQLACYQEIRCRGYGEARDERALRELEALLRDDDPTVKQVAVFALARMNI